MPDKDSAEAYLGTEFMTEKLKFTDFLTRVQYYPEPDDLRPVPHELSASTSTSTCRATGTCAFGFFDNFDSHPPEGFSKNDYGWSNAFGFKF